MSIRYRGPRALVAFLRPFHHSYGLNSNMPRNTSTKQTINKEDFIRYLACPLSKDKLRLNDDKTELISDKLNVAYPIVDGIPDLIPHHGRIRSNNENESRST
ncbi:Protein preY, mitochondrial [Trichoplax sp. H2]|nr:Protein preY, mitochondrial [Trichoplax sp. H2]|eukprot:RDD46910.1 Protein preY, mitochondrial [Trichoplax sp. H2]